MKSAGIQLGSKVQVLSTRVKDQNAIGIIIGIQKGKKGYLIYFDPPNVAIRQHLTASYAYLQGWNNERRDAALRAGKLIYEDHPGHLQIPLPTQPQSSDIYDLLDELRW